MSIVNQIYNVGNTAVDTKVPTIVRSSWKVVSKIQNPDGSRETIYRDASSDVDFPLDIRVGIYPNLRAGTCNYSVRLTTGADSVNDETGETVWSGQVSAVMAITVPVVSSVIDQADFFNLISAVYSAFYDGVTAEVPNLNVVGLLDHGIAELDA